MEVVLKIKSWGVMYFSQIVVNGDFVGDGFTFSIEFEVWQAAGLEMLVNSPARLCICEFQMKGILLVVFKFRFLWILTLSLGAL